MAKGNNKISIPILILCFMLGFIPGIIYLVVKLGGAQGTSETIGENVKVIKEKSRTSSDKYDDLGRLQSLKKSGAITEKEYEEEKKKILSK